MGSSGLLFRVDSISSAQQVGVAVAHNSRELPPADNIDAERSHLNFALSEAKTRAEVKALTDRLLADAGCMFKRKNAVRAAELLFSLPIRSTINAREYFTSCVAWAKAYYRAPLLCAHVHLDESAPHCHALLLPLRDGELIGSKLLGDRRAIRVATESLAVNVGHKYGVRIFAKSLSGSAKRAAVAAIKAELKASGNDILRNPLWPCIRDGIDADPQRWLDALGIEASAAIRARR